MTDQSRRLFIGTVVAAATAQSQPSAAGVRPLAADHSDAETARKDLTQSQLFLDDTWIEETSRLERKWQTAEIFPQPVLQPTAAWEGRQVILYGSVFRTGDDWRMYYHTYSSPEPMYFCMATSSDGLRWERPNLGLVEYKGSKANNIVWAPAEGERHDGITVCYDPVDPQYSYRLMYYCERKGQSGAYVAFSKDGLLWKHRSEPVITNILDHMNLLSTRDHNGKFVAFLRSVNMGKHRARTVWRSDSKDFLRWSEPASILRPDLLDGPNIELYGMSGFRYSDMYLGMLEKWYGNPDLIEIELAWSHDGLAWRRPAKRSVFIGATFPWNKGWTTCANTAPIQFGNQLWIYFGGRSSGHSRQHPQSYGAIGLATITIDRFAAIRADFREGQLITKPMTWPNGDLVLNSTSARYPEGHPKSGGGDVSVEVRDENNQPLRNFCGENRARFNADAFLSRTKQTRTPHVRWPNGRSVRELAGRRIRLVFLLRDARLYSFRAQP